MKHYTATVYSYGFEYEYDLRITDSNFKNLWKSIIKTIKDFAHNDAAYDGWWVKFEADGKLLDTHIRVKCNPDTRWTNIFAVKNGKVYYITSTLAQY
jgi:hypothetical protein